MRRSSCPSSVRPSSASLSGEIVARFSLDVADHLLRLWASCWRRLRVQVRAECWHVSQIVRSPRMAYFLAADAGPS